MPAEGCELRVEFQIHLLSGLFARSDALHTEYASATALAGHFRRCVFSEEALDMPAGRMHCPPRVSLTTTNSDRLVKQQVSEGLSLQHLLSLVVRVRFREFASAERPARANTRSVLQRVPGSAQLGIQNVPVKNTMKPASSTDNSGADQ